MMVATWNFEKRGPHTRKAQTMMDRLAAERPALICLTEAHEGSTAAFGGHEIAVRGIVWSRAEETERKVVLWSAQPWRELDVAGPEGCEAGAYLSGVTNVNGVDVWVVGVCIPHSFASPLGVKPKAKPWSQHITYLLGLKTAIANRLRDLPCIVLGDYNQFIPRIWGSKAAAAAMSDALGDLLVSTSGPMKGFDNPAIDHIAHCRMLSAASVRTLSNIGNRGERLSDHYGMVVDLRRVRGNSEGRPDHSSGVDIGEQTRRVSRHCIGAAAMGLVQYKLSLLGWNVIPTSRNSAGADLYITDLNGVGHAVQVKGIRNLTDWISASSAGKGACKWWIIVRGIGGPGEEVFVQTEQEVIDRTNRHGWSEPLPEARNAWHRIGIAPPRQINEAGD